MTHHSVSLEDRQAIVSQRHATLNGKPAVITGAHNDFATVAVLNGCERAEWAWPTAQRIMANGGEFRA